MRTALALSLAAGLLAGCGSERPSVEAMTEAFGGAPFAECYARVLYDSDLSDYGLRRFAFSTDQPSDLSDDDRAALDALEDEVARCMDIEADHST